MGINIDELIKKISPKFKLHITEVELSTGEITALVGANGAGKTTLLKLLMGYIKSDMESIHISKDSTNIPSFQDIESISYIDSKSIIEFLTIKEYLDLFKQVNKLKGYRGIWNDEVVDLLLREALQENKLIRDLSLGTQVKVGICTCFLRYYDFVVLDEPFAHLDPPSQEIVCNLMRNYMMLFDYKTILLFSSHDLRNIVKLADNVIFLKQGMVTKKLQKNDIDTVHLESLFELI